MSDLDPVDELGARFQLVVCGIHEKLAALFAGHQPHVIDGQRLHCGQDGDMCMELWDAANAITREALPDYRAESWLADGPAHLLDWGWPEGDGPTSVRDAVMFALRHDVYLRTRDDEGWLLPKPII